MNENTPMDEVRLAELLRELPPAPEAWLQAAQERPAISRAADQVLELAEVLPFRPRADPGYPLLSDRLGEEKPAA